MVEWSHGKIKDYNKVNIDEKTEGESFLYSIWRKLLTITLKKDDKVSN